MCFSFSSSINSWFIALIGSIFLLAISNNTSLALWTSAFTLTFTQIQIIEAIIWKSLEMNKNADVSNVAKYIPILLWFQPFVQSLFGYFHTKNIFLLYLSFVYMLIILFELNTNDRFEIKISNNNHLVWKRIRNGKSPRSDGLSASGKNIYILGDNYLYGIIYLFGLVAPVFFISDNLLMKYGLASAGIISFIYSLSFEPEEFNSMWCYYAINYILIANLAELITIYKSKN